ncbi:MAG: DNA-damage-inducible protein J [Candidatus Ruthia sp. Asou_11_S2]|nr:DNA-damage-inducible protein J [Candidatus Ruthia sp. Asou_11_S2]
MHTRTTTSIKLDTQTKYQAQTIFKDLGITMGEAFNIFLKQVTLHKGLPFEVKIPNAETKKAIKEARLSNNVGLFNASELGSNDFKKT